MLFETSACLLWTSVTRELFREQGRRQQKRQLTPENNDLIGEIRKNNCAARAARNLVAFFDVACQTTTLNFQI